MSHTPWPAAGSDNILFLLDASHRAEEDLLQQWLDSADAPAVNGSSK